MCLESIYGNIRIPSGSPCLLETRIQYWSYAKPKQRKTAFRQVLVDSTAISNHPTIPSQVILDTKIMVSGSSNFMIILITCLMLLLTHGMFLGRQFCLSCYAALMGFSQSTAFRHRQEVFGSKKEERRPWMTPKVRWSHGHEGSKTGSMTPAGKETMEWMRRNFWAIGELHSITYSSI